MSFLKRLFNIFGGGPSSGSGRTLPIYVLSHRCNEPIAGSIDLLNELSIAEEDASGHYYTRKVLHTTGERRCFDQVEVHLYLDTNKNIIDHQVQGGRWLELEEYEAELARFNAPPPEEDELDTESAGELPPAAADAAEESAASDSSLTSADKDTNRNTDHPSG